MSSLPSFAGWRGFNDKSLSAELKAKLTDEARRARGHILKMTTLAASGHPGGSMSSIEIYMLLYHLAKVDPDNPMRDDRDRIIISHGHTSPGVYSALASAGFFEIIDATSGFRQAGSPFEGHVERMVPGVEWATGNLSQGLSVGVGKAIYARLSGQQFHTFVVMGDGEQQKGQISEARRMAVKFGLTNITGIIDCNHLQISGRTDKIMPQNLADGWRADGWQVVTVDGHDLGSLYDCLRTSYHSTDSPTVIIAETVMGKNVSFMENDHGYHGAAVKPDRLSEALAEVGESNNLDELKSRRNDGPPSIASPPHVDYPLASEGEPCFYAVGDKADNRSAFGKALLSFADANLGSDDFAMAVFDCDLAGSVKTASFEKKYPSNFFQCGISEHSTAAVAGSLSAENAVSVWADFAVFGIDETYNQARLNDINHSNLKLFCTHAGINVGEDGRTHHCIDYFGLLNNTFGWKVITPADPNHTDHIVRYVLTRPGNYAVIMGRSICPITTDADGRAFFGKEYRYRYGAVDKIRTGEQLALVAAGNMLPQALKAWEILKNEGRQVALYSISDWSDVDPESLKEIAVYGQMIVLEDHNLKTGLGTHLAAAMFEAGLQSRIIKVGVRDYVSSGNADELYRMLGMDGESVAKRIRIALGSNVTTSKD